MSAHESGSSTSDERWREADGLFSKALELLPSERAAFITAACGSDTALLARLQKLLASITEPGELLGSASSMLGSELEELFPDDDADDPQVGLHLAPYQLVRRIGRGGSGSVYEAARVDGLFDARVAIKVLRRGVDTEDVMRRFRAERRILASLQHPHIARLIDGGATPDGRPYIVMELVDGIPITGFCDRHRLTIRQRLELFTRVARTVEYAHQNLVVHRDIKPSNIMVKADGSPMLLDFGIAKLFDAHGAGSDPTATGVRIMTPAFASPEQLRGERITTATDVYQLGGLLYLLLAGRRPFDGALLSARTNPATEPPRPSTVVVTTGAAHSDGAAGSRDDAGTIAGYRRSEPQRMGRELRGDLDTIVMSCMQHEPARRYGSAAAVADDVQRFLTGHPIRARPPTISYTVLRYVRRRPGVVAALAAVVVAVSAYIGASTAHARQLQAERDRARSEESRATQVSEFLVGLFAGEGAAGERRDTLSARALLDAGVERIRTDLREDPQTRSTLLLTLGEAYDRLGAGPRALDLLDEALKLHIELYGEADPRSIGALEQLARAAHVADHNTNAHRHLIRAIGLRRAQVPVDTTALAANLRLLSLTLGNIGRHDSALMAIDEAIALRRGSSAGVPYADLHDRGRLLYRARDLAGAELAYSEALTLMRAAALDEPEPLILLLQHYGMVLRRTDRAIAAETLYLEALALQRANYGADAPRTIDLIKSVARVFDDLGKHDQAEPLLLEAVAVNRTRWGTESWQVASAIGEVGAHLFSRRSYDRAEAAFRESRDITIRVLGGQHAYAGNSRVWLARALTAQSRFDEAEVEALAAMSILEASTQDAAARWLPDARRALAALYDAWGRPEEAAAVRRRTADRSGDPPVLRPT